MKEFKPFPVSTASTESLEKKVQIERLKHEATDAYTELREMELESPFVSREGTQFLDDETRTKLEKNEIAFKKFDTWNTALLSEVKEGDLEAKRRAELEVTLFFYNLGFRDPLDLQNLLSNLEQDLENVASTDGEGTPNGNPDTELENTIKTKIAEIKSTLSA